MSILERFSTIMRSEFNALLDKVEDPEKVIEQNLLDLRHDLAEVKTETAEMMANEKQAKRRLDDCQADIAKYGNAAANALKAGNEDDARKLIAKKQKLEANLPSLQATYDAAVANSDRMRQMYDKLTADIEALEARKDAIKGKMAAAKAQKKVNEMVAGSADSSKSIEAFERMEQKANKMFDSAMAEAELNAGSNSDADLLGRYSGAISSDVDDELARMKKELGL
jgi:phage shock protein A